MSLLAAPLDSPEVGRLAGIRQSAGRRGRAVGAVLLLFVCCSLLMMPLIALQVHRNSALSPIDEVAYTDYLYKVSHGHYIIGAGEQIQGETNRELICRGLGGGLRRSNPSRCTAPLPRPSGRNTADIDPPTYYVLTYGVARGLESLGVTDNLVTAGRLGGAAWAGSALTVIVLLCRSLGASRLASTVAATVAGLVPGLVMQWHYITPHAADLTVGGLVMLAVLSWERRRVKSWALLAGALPALVKASEVEISLAAVLYLLIGALWRPEGRSRPDRRRLLGSLAVFAALGLGSVGWLLVRDHYALTHTQAFTFFDASSFQPHFLLDNIGQFLVPWSPGPAMGLTAVVVVWCYGTAARTTTEPGADPALRRLSLAVMTAGTFGAVVLVISNYLLQHAYYPIPVRYGFALVPVALALGATAVNTRAALAAGAALCALLLTQLLLLG